MGEPDDYQLQRQNIRDNPAVAAEAPPAAATPVATAAIAGGPPPPQEAAAPPPPAVPASAAGPPPPPPPPAGPPPQPRAPPLNLPLQYPLDPAVAAAGSPPRQQVAAAAPPPLPAGPPPPPPPPTPLNLPLLDLLDQRREYIEVCVPLYEASIKGDWEAAWNILQNREYLARYSITENYETALHVAASAESTTKSTLFVNNLVQKMRREDLQLQNKNNNTALCLAAAAGNVGMAKIMVGNNPELLKIRGSKRMMPLYLAALFGKRDMVTYLYGESQNMTGAVWSTQDKDWVFLKCIEADLFDVALQILEDHQGQLPQDRSTVHNVLEVLARKPHTFNDIKPHAIWKIMSSIICVKVGPAVKESEATQLLRKIWRKVVEKPKVEIGNILRGSMVEKDGKKMYPSRILFVATEMGNSKFVVELIRKYPDLIWKQNDNNQSIFHIAISHRHENIYNLLYEIGSMKDMITPFKDPQGNNMLHLVGKKAEKNGLEDVSGVAFQMQRELLWFKEVEAMIPPSYRERKNIAGLTPRELFILNHKDLASKGEKWMKGTAKHGMVVAALLATIVFAVAFTIPGGYNQKNGFPMFLEEAPFIVFVMLDAISLILSSTSILIFLSILTSRYAQDDFLKSLPKKLMIGLATLFLSIMTMMVAFSVSFFVLYHHKLISIPIVISVIAFIPIFLYAKLQCPLLLDVYRSTYGSRYLFKPKKRMLYYENPRF